jgi:hypothetical protein
VLIIPIGMPSPWSFWTGLAFMDVVCIFGDELYSRLSQTATLGIAKWRNWFGYGTINIVIVDQLVNTFDIELYYYVSIYVYIIYDYI